MHVDAATFERLVAQALSDLPDWVQGRMDNVVVIIERWPRAEQIKSSGVRSGNLLLGLYEGIPLTRRGRGYQLVPPDRITLFQRPLELAAPDESALVALIRKTVIHEVAHHFGLSDDALRRLNA